MSTPDAYIIAEIGSNCFHYEDMTRNLDCAYDQIKSAAKCGADAVKFQFFTSAELWGPDCIDRPFAQQQDKFALPEHWLGELLTFCVEENIDFLCSAFSMEGFKKVDPFVEMHKLASPEVLAQDMLRYLCANKKPTIFSLGCKPFANMYEFSSRLSENDVILECVSDYPADPCHYDLVGARQLAIRTGGDWGISDHTKVNWLAKYARSIGARYFEKHVDFYPVGKGTPDSDVSCNTEEFKRYVDTIREQEVVHHQAIKLRPIKAYGRRMTARGWFRPWPGE
jgi:sialic acid synthase SpsE